MKDLPRCDVCGYVILDSGICGCGHKNPPLPASEGAEPTAIDIQRRYMTERPEEFNKMMSELGYLRISEEALALALAKVDYNSSWSGISVVDAKRCLRKARSIIEELKKGEI